MYFQLYFQDRIVNLRLTNGSEWMVSVAEGEAKEQPEQWLVRVCHAAIVPGAPHSCTSASFLSSSDPQVCYLQRALQYMVETRGALILREQC